MPDRLEELNYHHLYYFWNVVREGSVLRASRRLGVAQPTVSEQLHLLERALGAGLFERVGGRLVLSELGQIAYRYADEIFLLGRDLRIAMQGKPTGRPLRLVVGVTEGTPKLLAFRLLEPALLMPERPEIVCYEDPIEELVAQLASRQLDLVLSDAIGDGGEARIYSHLLGECGLSLFARRNLAVKLRPAFPRSLDGAPMLLPTPNTPLRRALDHWLDEVGVRPRIVGEVQDSGLMSRFGEQGIGVFPACSAVEEDMRTHHRVDVVGRIDGITQSFYALTVERRLIHPAVVLLSQAARSEIFRR